MREIRLFHNHFQFHKVWPSDARTFENVPVKITDLPLEILLCIFEELDLGSLASMAKTHSINWRAAEMVAKKLYIENISFDSKFMSTKVINDNIGSPFGFTRLLDTLESFGHLMKRIKIDYFQFSDENSEQINSHLSRFTVDSLNEIELHYFNDMTSKGFIGPFKKVEIVRMRFGDLKTNDFNLAQLFPAVKMFDLTQPNVLPRAAIEHHFPHLETFNFERMLQCDSPIIERRLQLNPQLRNVHIFSANWKGLRMISAILPNLERLDFLNFNICPQFEGDDIEFINLKMFGIDAVHSFPHDITRIPIVFGRLEEITCKSPDNKCFDVIIKNKNLKKIVSSHFSREQLQQMADKLLHLEELHTQYMAVHSGFDRVADEIKSFVEQRPTLWKIVFTNTDLEVCNAIAGQLNGWSFAKDDGYSIFTRD